ncbi:MAG: hypothetical protein ACE5FD_01290 [Anaerolineae bacterium]
MARSGMINLISRLRDMCNVTVDDWTDDELQTILDGRRLDVRREKLEQAPEYTASTANYYDFYSRFGNYEETDGGTAVFILEDSAGADKSTANWTANYTNGHIRFSADQGGTAIYLTGRSYDLFGAAADVWRQQMGKQAAKYTFAADGVQMSRSHWFAHCDRMAAHYDRLSRPVQVQINRGDVA